MDKRAHGTASFDAQVLEGSVDISRFAESYASFNRIINTLQRQYLQLKEEFSAQNDMLAEMNARLLDATRQNLAATEFLNGILKSISAGVIAVDQNGRVTHFNPAAAALLGIPASESLGKFYRDLLPSGMPTDVSCLRSAETGQTVEGFERQMTLGDGTLLQVSVSTALLTDKDGRANGAVEVIHDLTKLRKMERELARLNTLAALGEMAATIAHEVRNPLAGIGGFAALLKRDLEDGDPRRELTEKIIRGVESLNHTVTTLLNYTKHDEMNREDVPFGDFLEQVVRQFQNDNAEKVRDITIDLQRSGTDAAIVKVDTLLMRQLLFNLLSNAAEAMHGQGKIDISSLIRRRSDLEPPLLERLVLGSDEGVLETSITDHGQGIPEDALESIFAPFFTTKPGGTGLGLAVAWKIMKAHGGEIVADNLPSRGARFRILLPMKVGAMRTE